jgi:hypothetical protein
MLRMQDGDEEALRRVRKKYGGIVNRVAAKMIMSPYLEDEAVRQTWATVATTPYDPSRAGPSTFIHIVAKGEALRVMRKVQKNKEDTVTHDEMSRVFEKPNAESGYELVEAAMLSDYVRSKLTGHNLTVFEDSLIGDGQKWGTHSLNRMRFAVAHLLHDNGGAVSAACDRMVKIQDGIAAEKARRRAEKKEGQNERQ